MKMHIWKWRLLTVLALAACVVLASCGDDDPAAPVLISFEEATYTLSENAEAALTIPVTLSRSFSTALVVPFDVSGTAVEGTDYATINPKTVTFTAGSTEALITITPNNNNLVESGNRTIILTLELPTVDGVQLSDINEATVTLTNDDDAGSVIADFTEAAISTNEYLEETVTVTLQTNTALDADITFDLAYGGTAIAGTHYEDVLPQTVTLEQGQTTVDIDVPIINTNNYDGSQTLTITLSAPENTVVTLGVNSTTTISIVNPLANVRLWIKDPLTFTIYSYSTYDDVAVPATGRSNSDPAAGTIFNESFGAAYYSYGLDNSKDPNAFGYRSTLWTEVEFTRSTNAFNMTRLYDGANVEIEGTTKDEGVSSASAGIRIEDAIRLSPDAIGSKTGTATVIPQTVRIYRPDDTDDGIVNPTFFDIGISGTGTYNEDTGIISLRVVFDETAINNGIRTRRYEIVATRR